MKKISALFYTNTTIGFAFWFIIGVLTTIIFYRPFEQPILFDRAYLLYMSQVVFRGDSLYHSTTFGYTPMSVLLVAFSMKIGAIFSVNTILSAKISGLILYGFMCGSFFALLKKIFYDSGAAWIGTILFVGLGFLQILSGVNAEPKTFVLFFSILGMYFLVNKNWLMAGLCFSAGAMCWHVAAISIVACAAVLPWHSTEIKPLLLKFLVGIFLGTVPVLIYLGITDGWIDFWNQAILRKLAVEGGSIGEVPWRWLFKSIYPSFVPDAGHFILGFIGFVVLVGFWFFSKNKSLLYFKDGQIIQFILAYVLIWSVFNTIEFQGSPDIIPLLGIIVILFTFLIVLVKHRIKGKLFSTIAIAVLILYNFFDAFFYKIPFTYQEEVGLVSEIKENYGDPFVIGFEEYYTILEKPMPTKFMRYALYEDFFLMDNGTCNEVTQFINTARFDYFIEINRNKTTDYEAELKSTLANRFDINYNPNKVHKRGVCTSHILSTFTNLVELDSMKIKDCFLPLSDLFVRQSYYSIYGRKELVDKLELGK